MHILPQPLLVVLQGRVAHLFDEPLDVAAVLQDDGSLFLHLRNVLGGHGPHLQHLQQRLIVVLEEVRRVALHPVVCVDQRDHALEVPKALLVVDVLHKGHIPPVMLPDVQQLQRPAVDAAEIPAVLGRPELHLLDDVLVLVLGVHDADGRHGRVVPRLADINAAVRRHLGEADLRVLIQVEHFKAVPVDAGTLGQLHVLVLLIVVVEDVLQRLQVCVILGAVDHRLADEVPGGRVRDIFRHVVDQAVIGGGAILLPVPEDVVVALVVSLQPGVLGVPLVFVNDLLDVRLRQAV